MNKWRATLSNNEVITENEGEWVEVPGERLPWARLCEYTVGHNLYIDKLEFMFRDTVITLPTFPDKFLTLKGKLPFNYSIQTIMDLDVFSGTESSYLDLCSHYEFFDVHYVVNLNELNQTWLIVTDPGKALCKSNDSRVHE